MELNKLNRTCSMYELGIVENSDLQSVSDFKVKLLKLIYETFGDRLYQTFGNTSRKKAIIYNTNYSWFEYFPQRWILYKNGFRQISKYRGSNGIVYVLLKKNIN